MMDGSRQPGPQCQTRTNCDVNDGTTNRTRSPRPGPIRQDAQRGAQRAAAPTPAGRVTHWPSPIPWSRFPEITHRPDGETEDAQTACDIRPTERVQYGRENGRFFLRGVEVVLSLITTGSLEDKSWVVRGTKTDALRRHEQGHWDISGLSARDLHRALVNLRVDSQQELRPEIDALIERAKQTSKRIGDQYDDETEHSRNVQKQREWEEKIAAWMADPDGTLPD